MALVVVGDFESKAILELINKTFGRLERKSVKRPDWNNDHEYFEENIVTGSLSPVLGSDAETYVRFRIPGFTGHEHAGWSFICNYLERQFYNELRVQRGLVYSASCDPAIYSDHGEIQFSAESRLGDRHEIYPIMLNLADSLIEAPLDAETFERERRRMLLAYVGFYQNNEELADYYALLWRKLLWPDRFVGVEEKYMALTPEGIQALAAQYLTVDRAVIVQDVPTLTYNTLYIGVGSTGALGIFLVLHWMRRRWK